MQKSILIVFLLLTACVQDYEIKPEHKMVTRNDWEASHNKPYPFLVEKGAIACVLGRVYFYPDDSIDDEAAIGYAVNKAAKDADKKANIFRDISVVSVDNASVDEVVEDGIKLCKD